MQPYHYCPSCARVALTEAVDGTDSAERVCLECGAALFVDPMLIADPAERSARTRTSVA